MPPIYSVVSSIFLSHSPICTTKTETSHTALSDEPGDGRSRFQRSSLGSMACRSGGHKRPLEKIIRVVMIILQCRTFAYQSDVLQFFRGLVQGVLHNPYWCWFRTLAQRPVVPVEHQSFSRTGTTRYSSETSFLLAEDPIDQLARYKADARQLSWKRVLHSIFWKESTISMD